MFFNLCNASNNEISSFASNNNNNNQEMMMKVDDSLGNEDRCSLFNSPIRARQPQQQPPRQQRGSGEVTKIGALEEDIAALSVEEREYAYSELHCCPDEKIENPDEIQLRLIEFDCELKKLLWNGRKEIASSTVATGRVIDFSSADDTDIEDDKTETVAYRIARRQNKAYVEDPKLRLKFLRADKYDPERAANRFLHFFTLKLRLFGKSKLTQEILIQDLGDGGMYTLDRGFMQYCPLRDRAGRRVVTIFMSAKQYWNLDDLLRVHFYYLMAGVEEESDQIKGLNAIIFRHSDSDPSGPSSRDRRRTFFEILNLIRSVPARLAVAHMCMEDMTFAPMLRLALKFVDSVTKFVHRFHIGSYMECIYALQSFGVPVCALPLYQNGTTGGIEISLDSHRRWVQERKALDGERMELRLLLSSGGENSNNESNKMPFPSLENNTAATVDVMEDSLMSYGPLLDEDGSSSLSMNISSNNNNTNQNTNPMLESSLHIIKPTNADVLLGKGRPLQKHPGNIKFRDVLMSHYDQYENASKNDKTRIAEQIVDSIKSGGSRFLKPVSSESNNPIRPLDDDVVWGEVGDNAARSKVAFTFRSIRKARSKQQQ